MYLYRIKVYGWGQNFFYQCANGQSNRCCNPTMISTLTKVKKIKAGSEHSMAMTQDREFYFWGNNDKNQCLINTNGEPVKVPTVAIDDKYSRIQDVYLVYGGTQIVMSSNHSEESSKGLFQTGFNWLKRVLHIQTVEKDQKQNVKYFGRIFA